VSRSAKRPRAGAIGSWLAVTALGLGIGALGAGGLFDLLSGKGSDSVTLPANLSVRSDPSPPGEPPDATGRALQTGRVIAPSTVPGGAALKALPGSAPSARVATDGNYVPFTPTSIRLPSGRLADVLAARVRPDGVLNVPQNPNQVGWWTGGAQADEPYGSIVLAGHVDTAARGTGVLAEMMRMRTGDRVKLADGVHGQIYRVRTVGQVPKAKLSAGTDLFDQNVKHRLVLITCAGPFDQRAHSYRDNLVIVATPVA
jgi:hypothetical protein